MENDGNYAEDQEREHDTGAFEQTDIDSDEELDGEVDARGGAAIDRRND